MAENKDWWEDKIVPLEERWAEDEYPIETVESEGAGPSLSRSK